MFFLRAAMIVMLLTFPAAIASPATEAHPDCETGQPWVGYRTTDPAREAYEAAGSPGLLAVCEGEHWDGQDPIETQPSSCTGSVRSDASHLHVGFCQEADPNRAPGNDPLDPARARVSADGTHAAYASANLFLLARFAVHVDGGSVAVYVRDDTPGNAIATLVTSGSRPLPSDGDCDQATYQDGAYSGARTCSRDNTAITFEHGLLA